MHDKLRTGWLMAVLLSLALGGCGLTDPSGLPPYGLWSENPADCAVEDTNAGTVTAPVATGCHVHMVFTAQYSQNVVRLLVQGTFLGDSQVYLLINANALDATDGWVIQFDRGPGAATTLAASACETESCTGSAALGPFANAYNVNDTFSIAAEVDRTGGSIDPLKAWADTDPTTTPAGDLFVTASNAASFTGGRVGISIVGATISGASVEPQ